MAPMLPPDVILLICEELGNLRAFGSLFNIALSGKSFAGPALLWMYRVHEHASIRGDDSSDTKMTKRESLNNTAKWALQWKSIILSSLGKTAYPYCLYIRSIDLTNLSNLFDDNDFKSSIFDTFFVDSMSAFLPKSSRRKYPDPVSIVNLVGESISKYAGESADRNGGTAALEELRGNIDKDQLPAWIARLPRLKSLTLWRGSVLDKTVADVIKRFCSEFNALSLYEGKGDEVDPSLASFFYGLPFNTLRLFQIISYNDMAGKTFLALNNHHRSLTQLSLGSLPTSAIKALSLLKRCTSIQTLELHDMEGTIDLEATENDSFLEIIGWLTNCKNMKSISLTNFVNGPRILTSVCLEHAIQLESLLLVKYLLPGNQDFHRALAHQTSLESLYLRADADADDDIETLVSSLCKLINLKYLNILDISDYFHTSDVQLLAMHLSKLEDFSVGGLDVNDEVWHAISTLPNLRSLSFHAITSFTFKGIINYIKTLRPTNVGLQLSVLSAVIKSELSDRERAAIRAALANKVDGKFDFEIYKEAESEFESDSD